MKYSVSNRRDLTIVKIEEPVFDVRSAGAFRQSIHDMLQEDGRKNLIFDFSLVKAIDSCGVGSLLLAHQMANRCHGLAIFVSLCQQIKDLLKLSGLDKQLYIFTSINEVITLVEPHGKSRRNSRKKSPPKTRAPLPDDSQKEIEVIASADFHEEDVLEDDSVAVGKDRALNGDGAERDARRKRGRPRKSDAGSSAGTGK